MIHSQIAKLLNSVNMNFGLMQTKQLHFIKYVHVDQIHAKKT